MFENANIMHCCYEHSVKAVMLIRINWFVMRSELFLRKHWCLKPLISEKQK